MESVKGHLWIRDPVSHVDADALAAVLSRYRLRRDSDVWQWITSFDRLITRDEKQWFLSHRDFIQASAPEAFAWNEYELMSLEAAEEDSDWKANICRFWDQHLPLYLDVRSDYRALVARIADGHAVGIFESMGPDFEEVTLIADSIAVMRQLILEQASHQAPNGLRKPPTGAT